MKTLNMTSILMMTAALTTLSAPRLCAQQRTEAQGRSAKAATEMQKTVSGIFGTKKAEGVAVPSGQKAAYSGYQGAAAAKKAAVQPPSPNAPAKPAGSTLSKGLKYAAAAAPVAAPGLTAGAVGLLALATGAVLTTGAVVTGTTFAAATATTGAVLSVAAPLAIMASVPLGIYWLATH